MNADTLGQRFSSNYLRHPELLPDSKRMRNRLASLFASFNDRIEFKGYIQAELGIRLGSMSHEYQWADAFKSMELRDVLDTITLKYRFLHNKRQITSCSNLISSVTRIFIEEQVRYTVDINGGVHFAVDHEFERVRSSVISVLASERYRSAILSFEAAFAALDSSPPDGKLAIRNAFFALENLFRLMFQTAHQLSTSELQKHLRPKIDQYYSGQKPALQVAHKQLLAFQDWVDGAHFYRHEPGTEEPAQPPLEIAILIVSQAGANLRWLATIDQSLNLQKSAP